MAAFFLPRDSRGTEIDEICRLACYDFRWLSIHAGPV